MAGRVVPAGAASCARNDSSKTAVRIRRRQRGMQQSLRQSSHTIASSTAHQHRAVLVFLHVKGTAYVQCSALHSASNVPSPLAMPTSRSQPSLAAENAWQQGWPSRIDVGLKIRETRGSCKGSQCGVVRQPVTWLLLLSARGAGTRSKRSAREGPGSASHVRGDAVPFLLHRMVPRAGNHPRCTACTCPLRRRLSAGVDEQGWGGAQERRWCAHVLLVAAAN
jgi:hypothetical protein